MAAWGWNESGQCGVGAGDVSSRREPTWVDLSACGCGGASGSDSDGSNGGSCRGSDGGDVGEAEGEGAAAGGARHSRRGRGDALSIVQVTADC